MMQNFRPMQMPAAPFPPAMILPPAPAAPMPQPGIMQNIAQQLAQRQMPQRR